MKRTKLKKPAGWRRRPASRFENPPEPSAPFRATAESDLERLKERLLRESQAELNTPDWLPALRRASNDAAALAWATPFPLLAFPELFREKAQVARRYAVKQTAVRRRWTPAMGHAA